MRRALISFFCCLLCFLYPLAPARAQSNQVTVTWNVETFGLHNFNANRFTITPLSAIGNDGNLLALGDPIRGFTTNSTFTTNLLNGSYYRVEIATGFKVYTLTNFFDVNTSGAVDGGNPLYRAFGQNQDRSAYAFSGAYSMAIFMLKYSGIASNASFFGTLQLPADTNTQVGYVWTATDTNGHGSYQASTGGSGGSATNAYRSQAGNGLVSMSTNTGTFVYTISGTDQTNALGVGSGLSANVSTNRFDVSGAATAATNGYPWGSLYDVSGSAATVQTFSSGASNSVLLQSTNFAAATTNGLSITSGLAAFRGTNTLASTNAATASVRGLVKVDNSTIVVAADGTISATTGGGGTVTSVGLSMPAIFSVANTPVTGAGTLTVTTNVNITTNITMSSGSMMKSVSGNGIGPATAGSDFVAPTTTITVAGTASQITSSAGAQDLSANRTWTLSFPNAMTLPGTLNVTGNQTNQGTLSVTGNSTNFGNVYFKGSMNGSAANLTSINGAGITAGTVNSNTFDAGTLAQLFDGGTVMSVDVAQQGYGSSGPITVSGTDTLTQNADVNHLGFSETNINTLGLTNQLRFNYRWFVFRESTTNSLIISNIYSGATMVFPSNGIPIFNGAGLTNILPANITGLLDASSLVANQYAATGSTTNLVSTQNGNTWTNLTGTNIVLDTGTLAPTSNATNYQSWLSQVTGMHTIYPNNTNINLSLLFTNLADVTRTICVDNSTGAVNCNLTFTFSFRTNQQFSAVVSNGFDAYYNFSTVRTSGVVRVGDAGRWH